MFRVIVRGVRGPIKVKALVMAALLGDLTPLGTLWRGARDGLAHGRLTLVAATHVARVILVRVEVLPVRDRPALPVRASQLRHC